MVAFKLPTKQVCCALPRHIYRLVLTETSAFDGDEPEPADMSCSLGTYPTCNMFLPLRHPGSLGFPH